MKHTVYLGPRMLNNFVALLLLPMALFLNSPESHAQGWSFTLTLAYSGPCGNNRPTIPTYTIPYMPNKSYCESIRASIMAIKASEPMYDNQGNYLGMCTVYYACGPCTGADISGTSMADAFGTGSVSIDGILQGSSFFSPHDSKEVESWMNDYLVRLKSMGISVSDINTASMQNIPLTGDSYIDNYYLKQAMGFESYVGSDAFKNLLKKPESSGGEAGNTPKAPEPIPLPAPTQPAAGEGIGTTVQLLTSYEEQKRRDDWNKEHGFENVSQVGSDNSIDADGSGQAVMSFKEAALREYVEGSTVGKIGLKTLEGSLSAASDGVTALTTNDIAGGEELGNELLSGKVIINVAKETAKDGITDAITGGLTGPLLGTVKGAGAVTSVITTSKSIWDRMHGNN